jgi:hypothetical protein
MRLWMVTALNAYIENGRERILLINMDRLHRGEKSMSPKSTPGREIQSGVEDQRSVETRVSPSFAPA